MKILEIKNLEVEIEGKKIIDGLSLSIEKGTINALMGPNGSGKSTLSNAIMGHPKYKITNGEIIFDGKPLNELSPDERARLGIFLSFQYPNEISGITIPNFLRSAHTAIHGRIKLKDFKELIEKKSEALDMNKQFLERYLNEGFSGGEKKKAEILQLLVLDPKLAILDETDSGLDIDALKTISKGINNFMNEEKTILIITHYKRILEHIKPDNVFIMKDGKIITSGDSTIVDKLEKEGYGWIDD